MLEFVIFLGLVVLRVVLLSLGAVLLLRPIRDCPACFEQSVPLVSVPLARVAPFLERRWCPHCGWQGLGRKSRNGIAR